MGNRYERIREYKIDKINLNSPIEIKKAVLLFDSKTGVFLLQMKLENIIAKTVKAVYLNIETEYIKKGEMIETHQLFDLNISKNQSFGTQQPFIFLEEPKKINIEIEKIVFSRAGIWRNIEPVYIEKIDQSSFSIFEIDLREQLKREFKSNNMQNSFLKFIPEEQNNIWFCSCGRPNELDKIICLNCGNLKEKLFNVINEKYLKREFSYYLLKEKEKVRLENIKEQEELRINKIQKKENSKKMKKLGLLVVMFLLIITTSYFTWEIIIQPNNQYNKGLKYIKEDKFEDAKIIFTNLADYKDSEKLLLEIREKIEKHENNVKKTEERNKYRSAPKLPRNNKYEYGKKLFKSMQFYEAHEYFQNLPEKYDTSIYLNTNYYIIEGLWMEENDSNNIISIYLEPNSKVKIEKSDKTIIANWDRHSDTNMRLNFDRGYIRIIPEYVNQTSGIFDIWDEMELHYIYDDDIKGVKYRYTRQ